MSFKRFENDDFVVSAEAVATGTWSENSTKLTTFFTSSNQEGSTSGKFYLNIFKDPSSNDSAEIQFGLAYGNKEGSGSLDYNSSIPGVSPTSTIFNQTKMQVLGDENGEFLFDSTPSEEIYVISVNRDRYKESMVPGSLLLHLSSSTNEIYLTDNSGDITGQQIQKFTDAGRVFDLKLSTKISSNSNNPSYEGSYGWFLPDTGLIILNPEAVNGALNDDPSISANSNDNVPSYILNWFQEFELLSQETISSNFLFVRPRSSEFNYSSNPSYVDSTTGEVLYEDFINNPKSYITTVGIYNDSNELLAVAKLSKPLEKNSTKEALVRVKLDF